VNESMVQTRLLFFLSSWSFENVVYAMIMIGLFLLFLKLLFLVIEKEAIGW